MVSVSQQILATRTEQDEQHTESLEQSSPKVGPFFPSLLVEDLINLTAC